MFSFHKKYFFFFPLAIFLMLNFLSCEKDNFTTNPLHTIEFSTDTITFDTLFTTIGSTTAKVMVYNHNSKAVRISTIALAQGGNSFFRINVDGAVNENNFFSNVEIPAHDSIYIFVEVTIDATDSDVPVLMEDEIVFLVNGIVKQIQLQAYGQEVEIFRDKIIWNDTLLTAKKPYLIYGNLIIDTARTLTLEAGTKFYFHHNANLIVYGNLRAEGTFEHPILMRGDRFDKINFETPIPYNVVAGQWGGIYLLGENGEHLLRHVKMNSGYVGIYLSNQNINSLPHLEINSCYIHNFLRYGLVIQNANVDVINTEISNTSSYCVYLNGGTHSFIHCTIVNYFNNSNIQPVSRGSDPAFMIMTLNRVAPMHTAIKNSVITGTLENEFSLVTRFLDEYKGTFSNNYIRKYEPLDLPQFTNIRWYEKNDTVFKNIYYDYKKNNYFNFEPDSISPIRDLGDYTIATEYCPLDLNGNNRLADGKPDAGAYEWKPTE